MINPRFKELRLQHRYTQDGLGKELRIVGDYVNKIAMADEHRALHWQSGQPIFWGLYR